MQNIMANLPLRGIIWPEVDPENTRLVLECVCVFPLNISKLNPRNLWRPWLCQRWKSITAAEESRPLKCSKKNHTHIHTHVHTGYSQQDPHIIYQHVPLATNHTWTMFYQTAKQNYELINNLREICQCHIYCSRNRSHSLCTSQWSTCTY